MEMGEKYYLDKLYVCNFKPFAYIDAGDKPYYEIDFNQGNARASMLFSGPNGYGKSSIFQAIEFGLMGEQKTKVYVDKIRTIQEHIFINNLEKPCFVALQLKSETNQAVTIVRYAQKGTVINRVEQQREAVEFHVYILEEAFAYERFEQMRQQPGLPKEATKEDLSRRLGEKNIQEWLKRNYIKQEQENAFIMQNDMERVNMLKGFTDMELDGYFKPFQDEKKVVEDECRELEGRIKELLKKIDEEIEAGQGERPVCEKIMEGEVFDWDKAEYQESDPFMDYASKAERTLKYIESIDLYRNYHCSELLSAIKDKEVYYQEFILALFEPEKLAEYRSSYRRNVYLRELIHDEDSLYKKPINKTYLPEKLAEDIQSVRERKIAFQETLNEKQRVYRSFEEMHKRIKGSENTVAEVFSEKCPLCGSDFKEEGKSLSLAIAEAAKMVQNMRDMLDSSHEEQQRSISEAYRTAEIRVEMEARKERNDREVFEAIESLEKYTNQVNQLKNEIGELIELSGQLENTEAICFTSEHAFRTKYHNVEDVKKIADKLKAIIDGIEIKEQSGEFELQTYHENKQWTRMIQKAEEGLSDKIKGKIGQLKWLAREKEAKEYAQNKEEYKRLLSEYQRGFEKKLKLDKIIACRERAKKRYMENVAKYLEIPLYIYSGKLMQTSQNDLGITCFTGIKNDELTQFKMTAGQNQGKGKLDITEKFSAGQRAVANIALILALKKIAVANLDIFMIDDPCQSLDELNIASFVEIMKNEFSDTQLILSTHEDKIAAYMKYKFEKANKKMCIFNVQERLYGTL